MKTFTELAIPGVFQIDMFHAGDDRGMFVKPYHKKTLEKHGLVSEFRESFYSTNRKGVIRGMHFQIKPYSQTKLLRCISGSIIEVLVNIDPKSKCFLKYNYRNILANFQVRK